MSKAVQRDISLLLAIDPRVPDLVVGEINRLKQAIQILVIHGINHAKANGGKVVVSVELKNNLNLDGMTAHVAISVKDDGVKYSQSDVREMFSPYGNLTPGGLTTMQGSGMGICIAKQVMELHGGVLNIVSSEKNGTTFISEIAFNIPVFTTESKSYLMEEIISPNSSNNTNNYQQLHNNNILSPMTHQQQVFFPTGQTQVLIHQVQELQPID